MQKINLKVHLIKSIIFSRESIITYCGLTFTRKRMGMQRKQMRACKSCLKIMLKEAGTTMLHTDMIQ